MIPHHRRFVDGSDDEVRSECVDIFVDLQDRQTPRNLVVADGDLSLRERARLVGAGGENSLVPAATNDLRNLIAGDLLGGRVAHTHFGATPRAPCEKKRCCVPAVLRDFQGSDRIFTLVGGGRTADPGSDSNLGLPVDRRIRSSRQLERADERRGANELLGGE